MKNQRKSNIVQAATLFFFIVNICLAMILVAPSGHYNPLGVLDLAETQTEVTEVSSSSVELQMILEWKLVDRFREGNWAVEKYREYEKYLDGNGKIVKEIPTDHYNFLRYWRYP